MFTTILYNYAYCSYLDVICKKCVKKPWKIFIGCVLIFYVFSVLCLFATTIFRGKYQRHVRNEMSRLLFQQWLKQRSSKTQKMSPLHALATSISYSWLMVMGPTLVFGVRSLKPPTFRIRTQWRITGQYLYLNLPSPILYKH